MWGFLFENETCWYSTSWWQGLPEALMKAGAVYKYDLSLPLEKMYDLVEEMRAQLGNYDIH